MRAALSVVLVGTLVFGSAALAADPADGRWRLDIPKSSYSDVRYVPRSETRAYSDTSRGTTLDDTAVGYGGGEQSIHSTMLYDGKDYPISGNNNVDSVAGKMIDAHTLDLTLMKDGKVVSFVHRVLSTDGRTLTVHRWGKRADGKSFDDTLVYERDISN